MENRSEKQNTKPSRGNGPGRFKWVFRRFLVVALAVFTVAVVRPDKAYSEKEKRALATRDSVSVSKLAAGELDEKVEAYVSDQLPGRDALISLRSLTLLATGNRYSQGVVLGKKGQMMEPFEAPGNVQTARLLEAVRKITEKSGVPGVFVAVPTAVSVLTDLQPAQLRTDDQEAWASLLASALPSGVTFCDLSPELKALDQAGTQVYYRSDHHWRTEAAYACLPKVAEALGIESGAASLAEDYWTKATVTDSFHGSLAAKSGYLSAGEDIDVYVPAKETAYVVTDVDRGTRSGSIYNVQALSGEDPYRVFGDNAGELRIVTEHADKGRLLVFKDSYFNCFLPFLLSEYHEIDVIDPRYYSGSFDELMTGRTYDKVLYFYNLNTLSGDTALAMIAGGEESR